MSKRKKVFIGLGLAFVALAAFPYVKGDMERTPMDDAARAALPDEHFVKLSDGYTRYEWAGPEEGPVVVLVHGLTSPSFIWDEQMQPLADAGFRVLRYDLYGRGHSDRPAIRYDDQLYDRQLLELLDNQGITEPVRMVGLSMGGATTIRFADRHPERIERVALFAPAGFSLDVPAAANILRVPGVGEWIVKAFGDMIIQRGVATRVAADPAMQERFVTKYLDQMQYKGYKYALLSTLRHNPLQNLGEDYARVGKQNKPCALFWGTDDAVVPYTHHERVAEAIPQIQFHAIEGVGHTANFEDPAAVNPLLIGFLKGPTENQAPTVVAADV